MGIKSLINFSSKSIGNESWQNEGRRGGNGKLWRSSNHHLATNPPPPYDDIRGILMSKIQECERIRSAAFLRNYFALGTTTTHNRPFLVRAMIYADLFFCARGKRIFVIDLRFLN